MSVSVRTRSMATALVGAVGIVAGVLATTTAEGALRLTLVGLMYAVGRIMLVGGAVAARPRRARTDRGAVLSAVVDHKGA